MMVHDLKIKPRFYEDVLSGRKQFELCRDDRGFCVGDKVCLREWNEDVGDYTGRSVTMQIIYILRDVPEYGLMEGYCIFGFKEVGNNND